MAHRRTWTDPYGQSSDTTPEDEHGSAPRSDADMVMDARIRPVSPTAYAYQSVSPYAATRPPDEQLMYAPRSPPPTTQHQWPPGAMPPFRQLNDTNSRQEYGTSPPVYPTRPNVAYAAPGGRSHHLPTDNEMPPPGARVGVGVVLDGSSHDETPPWHASFPSHVGPPAQQQQRLPSSITNSQVSVPSTHEGTPRPPAHAAIEPAKPPPRRSRRFQNYAKRIPDIYVGTPVSSPSKGQYTISCDSCSSILSVPNRTCVLVKCPTCTTVSSVSPVRLKELP